MILIFTAVSVVATIAVLAYTIYCYDQLAPPAPLAGQGYAESDAQRIDVRELGKIEGSIERLQRVIVMAHQVERPTDELAEAVEMNFRRGVKYIFLVSRSRAQLELNGYYKIFEALAEIALARDRPNRDVRDLVEIKQLPFDWDDYPFIFYQVSDDKGAVRTIAFRGEQLHEGIADFYTTIPPSYAHTIATSVLADGPGPIDEPVRFDRERFEDVAKVVDLERHRALQKGRG